VAGGREFRFLDPGPLSDGELALVLRETRPADPSRDEVPTYAFAMVLVESRVEVGSIHLRVGENSFINNLRGQIGYSVLPQHRGHGYARRACRLLFGLARRHGLEALLATCDPDNHASRKTLEHLGGELLGIVDVPPNTVMYRNGSRKKCRYRIALTE
jgi:tagatose 1,6-diphosphate aldolase